MFKMSETTKGNMHYANGREAKNGDRIMRVTSPMEYNKPFIGILHNAVTGNNTCNGNMAVPTDSQFVNLSECLHVDDVIAALGERKNIKDTSKQG